ncbi:MAG: STAS domain-containing protein [Butyrivibrio sp.]|nr:STAS domain-containing protein [Butyrivibrio sp.]
MTIEEVRDGDTIQLNVSGKIDTITAGDFQTAVLTSFQKGKILVINFKDVVYISSSGLRALVLGQKTAVAKGGSMKIININKVVEDVFKVTGFDKMLTIE